MNFKKKKEANSTPFKNILVNQIQANIDSYEQTNNSSNNNNNNNNNGSSTNNLTTSLANLNLSASRERNSGGGASSFAPVPYASVSRTLAKVLGGGQ